MHLLATAEFDIKKEAAWAISNATSGGTAQQIQFLVQAGCIRPMCDLLSCSDPRIITVALEGLENMLKIGEAQKELGGANATNPYADAIDEAGGLDKIEELQSHGNEDIYQKAITILETYFEVEDGEVENLAPAVDGGAYAFGGGAAGQPQQFNFAPMG